MAGWQRLALLAGAAGLAGTAFAQPAGQKVTGPVATYWVSAQTQTGFGMPTGGGRPSMGQIMGMMGGGGGPQHSLHLQLGSSRAAQGAPAADHLPPSTLEAGDDLPLVTPVFEKPPPVKEEETQPVPHEYQRPRGRMLIFWGCGEHAKPGQPIVLDFAQMAAGKVPAGMEVLTRGLNVTRERPPSPSRNTTYGEWPNARSRANIPSSGSLVGEHTVQGNYSPTIRFSLGADHDFLGPLNLTTNARTPGGSVQLGWDAVSGARAYVASMVGGGQNETVVLWSSSDVQAAAFALPDYITPGDLTRLVASHALMGPAATSCEVPKEVVDAAPQGLVQMVAYGEEQNFVYPPRPKDPKVTWNQEWTVKVRYRSATGGLLGMKAPGASGQRGYRGDDESQQQQPQTPEDARAARRRAIMKGLGGMMGLP